MKKKLTQLRWLATMLMLVAAMVMPSAVWAQESTVTFTAKEGTVLLRFTLVLICNTKISEKSDTAKS